MIETFVGMDVVIGVLNVKFASTLLCVLYRQHWYQQSVPSLFIYSVIWLAKYLQSD